MKKIFYLKTCNTCKRFIDAIKTVDEFAFQEIKSQPITVVQIEQLCKLAGSYEALFSRRAKLYTEMGLNRQSLSEADYKHYLLHHYTFLKRPVVVLEDKIFIGSSKATLATINESL